MCLCGLHNNIYFAYTMPELSKQIEKEKGGKRETLQVF
jgi:hypothetical protein